MGERPDCHLAHPVARHSPDASEGTHVSNARGRPAHARLTDDGLRDLLARAIAQVNTVVLGKPQEVRLAFVACSPTAIC